MTKKEIERKALLKHVIEITQEKFKAAKKRDTMIIPCLIVQPGIRSREEICGHPYLSTNHFSFSGRPIKKSHINSDYLIQAAEESLNLLNNPTMTLCIIEELKQVANDEENLECLLMNFQIVLQKHLMGGFPHCKEKPLQNAHMNLFCDKLGGQEFIEKQFHDKI